MPETTALDIIQDALEKDQVYSPGETIGDADAQRCLNVLNNMLDSWSLEKLTCFATLEQSIALVVGTSAYTLGTGGNVPVRPIKVLTGKGAAYVTDTQGNRYPVDVIEQGAWNQLWNITAVNASWPTALFYDAQFPLARLNVYPVPNQGGMTLYWDSYLALTAFASLNTPISLPPGYKLAMVDTLARRLWRYFKAPTLAIPQDIILEASAAKANIKRINFRIETLQLDPALRGPARAYNPYSDSQAVR